MAGHTSSEAAVKPVDYNGYEALNIYRLGVFITSSVRPFLIF